MRQKTGARWTLRSGLKTNVACVSSCNAPKQPETPHANASFRKLFLHSAKKRLISRRSGHAQAAAVDPIRRQAHKEIRRLAVLGAAVPAAALEDSPRGLL
jgi:hypothetical protein